jgi:hypothetical protein
MQNKVKKTLLTLLTVGLVAGLVAFGAFSAFSSTTTNPNNNFRAGSVTLTSDNTATALYDVTGAKPGDSSPVKCITVTYSGSLPSTVKLYRSAMSGGTGLDTYLDLAITKGDSTYPTDCTGFAPAASGSSVFSAKLDTLGTTFGDAGALTLTDAGGSAVWNSGDAVTYRFQATLASGVSSSANGLITGSHSFSFEAQNN